MIALRVSTVLRHGRGRGWGRSGAGGAACKEPGDSRAQKVQQGRFEYIEPYTQRDIPYSRTLCDTWPDTIVM